MPLPPNTANYKVGGMKLIVGGIDFGNIVSANLDPTDITILDHFTARSGARKLDKRVVTEKRFSIEVGLDEHARELYREFFMGSSSPTEVYPLANPLAERNIVLEYREESGVIWTFSHTRCTVAPSEAMDFGEFDDWAGMGVTVALLEDAAQAPATFGRFIFT